MNKILMTLSAILCMFAANAATTNPGVSTPRYSIFSTSTDWEAVTGRQLHEYRGTFLENRTLVKQGLELYFLDGFPCYGLGGSVFVWVGPNGQNHEHLRIACVAEPTELKFAYRNAKQDAIQGTTTGILTCPVTGNGHELTIDLSDCTVGPDWDEYK
jgi:hypothetical protein